MKKILNLDSKAYRSLNEDMMTCVVIAGILERIKENSITLAISGICMVLFYITLVMALYKGWCETKSIRQVLKDNRFILVIMAIGLVFGIILLSLR